MRLGSILLKLSYKTRLTRVNAILATEITDSVTPVFVMTAPLQSINRFLEFSIEFTRDNGVFFWTMEVVYLFKTIAVELSP